MIECVAAFVVGAGLGSVGAYVLIVRMIGRIVDAQCRVGEAEVARMLDGVKS